MRNNLIEAMPLKVAILGVGRMGRRHIAAVRRAGHEIIAVFDKSMASLKLAQEEQCFETEMLYSDQSELYEQFKPDLVIIATTADSHCSLTCMAAERGVKYILVEKPMAVSVGECDLMIDTCKRYGAKLSVNHQMRFMEQYTEPKRLFNTEAYGGLASMTVVAGNFGFAMNATHYFEAFRFLTNEYPVEVTAWFSNETVLNPRGPQFQDRAGSIRAVTASGKRLYMEIGTDQGHGIRVIYACRNGMMTVDELSGAMISSEREEQYRALPTTRYGMPALDSQRMIQPCEVIDTSADVIRAMISDINAVSGEDGKRVIELLVAAYQSAESGSLPVRLDSGIDHNRNFPWA